MKGKSSGSGGTQVVKNETLLPQFYQDQLNNLFGVANQTADLSPVSGYQGPTLAPVTDEQNTALDLGTLLGSSNLGLGRNSINLGQDTAAGKYLDPSTNPYLRAATDAAIRPITQNFNENILPQIGGAAQDAGAYFGSQQLKLKNQAARDYLQQVGDTSAQIYANQYQQERQLQQQAPALIGQGYNLEQAPIQTIAGVGDTRRSFGQQLLDSLQQQYQSQVDAMWQPAQRLAGIIGGLGNVGGTSTSTTTAPKPSAAGSFLQGALGGGALGASAANALLPAATAAGPWGWALAGGAALLGGLGGAFGG